MDKKDIVLDYAARKGAISPREIEKMGISRQVLYRLYKAGKLVHAGRGIYTLKDFDPTEYHTRVGVMLAFPKAVLCLLSALEFHELTTQMPRAIWIALDRSVDRRTRKSRGKPPITIVRFSGSAFSQGIETHRFEGIDLRVYNPAKTVADCFKYRNKIGLDVAIEALADCIQQKKATRDQIWHYAKVCRVSRIIRPYMEAIG